MKDDYSKIADRHGVRLDSIRPESLGEKLEQLRRVLDNKSVPHPISSQIGEAYFRRASTGEPFSIGSLTSDSVELGEYANSQRYDEYSLGEHLSWACLIADQQREKARYACTEYRSGEQFFEIDAATIPDYYILNARIYQLTGWQLATVNMIIPAQLFFTCHSKKFFPVTTFMRPLEQDYLEEPDIGHDVAGHVATFTIPTVARLMQNHGLARDAIYQQRDERLLTAKDATQAANISLRADELLLYAERIYWFTVEFGLVREQNQTRAFGAGILSSPGETRYSIDSDEPNRILFDPSNESELMRLVTTDYLISEYQKTYFVTEDFSLLDTLTPERIIAASEKAARLPHFSWREIVPGDRVLHAGRVALNVNEKYEQVLAGAPVDASAARCALRNASLMQRPIDRLDNGCELDLQSVWSTALPDATEWIDRITKARETDSRIQEMEHALEMRPLSFVSDYEPRAGG
ncbi:MAG: hypothetical protein AB8B50_21685 [Pirellulaceae bacterium]